MTLLDLGTTDDDGTGTPLVRAGELFNALLGGVRSRTDDVGAATATRGFAYIVPASATGAWSGQDNDIAIYDGSAWQFYTPAEGTETYVQDDDERVRFDGTSWAAVSTISTVAQTQSKNPRYARAYLTSDDTAQDLTTAAAVSFDAANEVGGDTWWAGANPTRLTVPAGIDRVKLTGQVCLDSVTNDSHVRLYIFKNGSVFDSFSANWQEIGIATPNIQIVSPIYDVSASDYFEVFVTVESDTSVRIIGTNQRTWFQIEAVEGPVTGGLPVAFKGFAARRDTSVLSTPTGSPTDLVFNSEFYDTESAYNPANGIFTVPSSMDGQYMVFTVNAPISGSSQEYNLVLLRDTGSGFDPVARVRTEGIAHTLTSRPILLNAGDEFKVTGQPLSVSEDLQNNIAAFFSGHIVETSEDAFDYILDTNTARTLTAADFKGNRTIKLENASAITLTLDTGIVANGPLTIIQGGAGIVSWAGTSTINVKGSATGSNGQLSAFTIIPTETADEYDIIGDVV